jgi:hypothetical protein
MSRRLTNGWPDPDEMDREAVRLGWMTEEERISAAYQRIFARQLRRRYFCDAEE